MWSFACCFRNHTCSNNTITVQLHLLCYAIRLWKMFGDVKTSHCTASSTALQKGIVWNCDLQKLFLTFSSWVCLYVSFIREHKCVKFRHHFGYCFSILSSFRYRSDLMFRPRDGLFFLWSSPQSIGDKYLFSLPQTPYLPGACHGLRQVTSCPISRALSHEYYHNSYNLFCDAWHYSSLLGYTRVNFPSNL